DGGGHLGRHAIAPAGTALRAARRSLTAPKARPSTPQNTAPLAMTAAAKPAARPAGTPVASSGGWGAPMMWGATTSATATATTQLARYFASSRQAAPVAMAVPAHQSWRARVSATGMV